MSSLRKLDNLLNQAIWRIFNISEPNNIAFVRFMFGIGNLVELKHKRCDQFLIKFAGKQMSFVESLLKVAVWSDDRLSVILHGCSINGNLTTVANAIRDVGRSHQL
jgi:hypothetical protein